MRALNKAKEYCDYLIVGINSDASVKRLEYKHKLVQRPIIPEAERKEMLEAFECVDEVVIFNETTPYKTIKRLQPDVLFKGGDWKCKDIIGGDLVKNVIRLPHTGHSTTKIIKKIIHLYERDVKRNGKVQEE